MKTPEISVFLPFLLLSPRLLGGATEEKPRVSWVIDESYQGPSVDAFNKLRYEVPILMRQTLIDLAGRCGLDFRDGWLYPLAIKFVDHTPMGEENVLAYVQLEEDVGPSAVLHQTLNVNLAAYEQESFNFDKVFAHELVHAMLSDALGRQSADLPVWFHEGLAVYGANQGEKMVAVYVSRRPYAKPSDFINGLEGPHGALDYAEDYLAFKYIHDRHGVNSLHNLVQEVIKRKGDIPGAIEYTCFENWAQFQENARKFSEDEISQHDRQKMTHTESAEKPY